jgi:uncharacterized protein
MKNLIDHIDEIKERIKELNPYKIILYGSALTDNAGKDSDIDLLVVLNSESISRNFDEKMANKLLVRKAISDISRIIPIDLLVYTKKEYEIIMNNKNSFFNEIDSTGKTLYEKAG